MNFLQLPEYTSRVMLNGVDPARNSQCNDIRWPSTAIAQLVRYPQIARTRELGLVIGGSAAVYSTEIDPERD